MFYKSPTSGVEQCIYSEMYVSDAFIEEHDWVQRATLPLDDPDCKQEKVVTAMMFWSDLMHLANFRMAKLWPIYMMLRNLSKYVHALPSSGTCMHIAYIPHLADSFEDFASTFHCKWGTQRSDILTHCQREVMHAIWYFLLDNDFLHAYTYGMLFNALMAVNGVCTHAFSHTQLIIQRSTFIHCVTGILVLTQWSCMVLLATIHDKGLCPCPSCLIPKVKTDLMGQVQDLAQ